MVAGILDKSHENQPSCLHTREFLVLLMTGKIDITKNDGDDDEDDDGGGGCGSDDDNSI